MCNQNEWIVREAFRAYDRGDVARMMDFVDPEVDWTYRDPELEDSEPQVCHGRGELEKALRRRANRGLRAQLEEVIAAGDRVMLVMRTPGIDEIRRRQADERPRLDDDGTRPIVVVDVPLAVRLHRRVVVADLGLLARDGDRCRDQKGPGRRRTKSRDSHKPSEYPARYHESRMSSLGRAPARLVEPDWP